MATRLIFICHASTAATREVRFPDDESLDTHGRARAAEAARALPRLGEVRCSPETRCRETASAMGLDSVIDPTLADLDVGAWRGVPLAELQRDQPDALQTWLTDSWATPHGGEALRNLLDRVAGWLEGMRGFPRTIAVITHPAVIRAAVVHTLSARPDSFWRIDVSPLSQTRLSYSGNRWTLRETGHSITA